MLAMFRNLLRLIVTRLRGINAAAEIPGVKKLTTLDDWKHCLEGSRDAPVLVFKHSTACPISSEAHRHVARYLESKSATDPEVSIVRVIEERPVSNQIAEDLGLQHKSPQLILLRNGAAVWSTSHYGVHVDSIRTAVESK